MSMVKGLNPLRSGLGFNMIHEYGKRVDNDIMSLNPLRSGLGFNPVLAQLGAERPDLVSIPSDRVLVSMSMAWNST